MKIKIRSLRPTDAPKIAKIHHQTLAGDFLPSLGLKFLTLFYQIGLEHQLFSGFAAVRENKIIGFITGTKNSTNLLKNFVTKNPFNLSLLLSKGIIRNPKIIRKLFQTLFYGSKRQSKGAVAELLVIAVQPSWRRQGLGRKLVKHLEKSFRQQKITRYHVSVYASNRSANRFYQISRFKKAASFKLYGRMWRSYIKKVNG